MALEEQVVDRLIHLGFHLQSLAPAGCAAARWLM